MKDAAKAPSPVPVHTSPIIYRLVDTVRQATADLLPKSIETRVHGEATVQMVFDISVKGRKEPKRIAGSKVSNGVFQKARKARVVRKGEVLHTGASPPSPLSPPLTLSEDQKLTSLLGSRARRCRLDAQAGQEGRARDPQGRRVRHRARRL